MIHSENNIQYSQVPKFTLVGAGPGDPDLLTLKGVKALQSADVVLYDALANDALLAYAPARALKVFVGKRAGKHSAAQQDINSLIVKYAFQLGHVVRLKGGDPYIFGRGHEEQEVAEKAGIPTEVVPGISSAYAMPALQGIPLTKRGLNESFWVITGTTRSGAISNDIHLAAQSTATVVILMGMSKLKEIQQTFAACNKHDTPVAIIQNGSLPTEKVGVARVENMVEMAKKHQLSSPAIIIIGEVVSVHPEFISRKFLEEIKTGLYTQSLEIVKE